MIEYRCDVCGDKVSIQYVKDSNNRLFKIKRYCGGGKKWVKIILCPECSEKFDKSLILEQVEQKR